MRPSTHFDKWRNTTHPKFGTTPEDGQQGLFSIPMSKSLNGIERHAICLVSCGTEQIPWEHVSARISEGRKKAWADRTPTWDEMCTIKDIFWGPDEVVVQLHPAEANYVNLHKHVLHLWRPKQAAIPLPPMECV